MSKDRISLGLALFALAGLCGLVLVDGQQTRFKVDVAWAERDDLAPPQPGAERDGDDVTGQHADLVADRDPQLRLSAGRHMIEGDGMAAPLRQLDPSSRIGIDIPTRRRERQDRRNHRAVNVRNRLGTVRLGRPVLRRVEARRPSSPPQNQVELGSQEFPNLTARRFLSTSLNGRPIFSTLWRCYWFGWVVWCSL